MTNAMPNYGWLLSQVTCVAYVPLFGVIVLWSIFKGDITTEMLQFPMYKFAVMGCLDCVLCLMSVIGGAFTSGPAQLVLGQAVIPVTLALSSMLLKHRYHVLQYFGAIVIILGVLISKLDAFIPGMSRTVSVVQDVPIFNIIFGLAAIPNALSQIYKEVAFRDGNLDVNYMQFWVSVFQLGGGLLIAPVNALPILGSQRISLSAMPTMIVAGSRCLFMGENAIVENCGGLDQPPCDTCASAWVPLVQYLLFNISYNVFLLLIVKYGGASLSFVVATLRLPLTTLCFYSHAIMGKDATDPAPEDFMGLVVILIGLVAYRYGSMWCDMPPSLPTAGSTTRNSSSTTADGAVSIQNFQDGYFKTDEEGAVLSTTGRYNTAQYDPNGEEVDNQDVDDDDDDDDTLSQTEDVAVAALVLEPGPLIFRIHRHMANTIYLKPLESYHSLDLPHCTYGPAPCAVTKVNRQHKSVRPPRRRTMHDFRDGQIRKISTRRLPCQQPTAVTYSHDTRLVFSQESNSKRSSESDNRRRGDDTSDDMGYISEGSVNSLMAASRPAPMERRCETGVSKPRVVSGPYRSPSSRLSLMLQGGLDVHLPSSPPLGVKNRYGTSPPSKSCPQWGIGFPSR